MAYISAKTGTLVFVIINIVAATLFSIGVFIHLALSFLNIDKDGRPGALIDLYDIARVMNKYILWIAFSILDLVLSSFLLNGILKKKAEHIKVYFVYGTVKIFLAIFVVFSLYLWPVFDLYRTIAALLFLFSYSLSLYMIRFTYKNMETDKIQFEHKPLVEKCCPTSNSLLNFSVSLV